LAPDNTHLAPDLKIVLLGVGFHILPKSSNGAISTVSTTPSPVFSTPVKKKSAPPLFLAEKAVRGAYFFLEKDSQVILSASKCFKMTPYAIKMHLESIKLQ
jgi:hypothetical protein